IAGCSKSKVTQNSKVDFRDSLVGNYLCTKHYYTYRWGSDSVTQTVHGFVTDTVLGTVIINVSKIGHNDTLLDINNSVYSYSSFNNASAEFFSESITGVDNHANFVYGNDSIWFNEYTSFQWTYQKEYYYTGHKQ
ncbi:MAG: hypothetical protein JWO03_4088, partial [Bacteroidetes bacterium]|nr:hypothetical protein [Bacteroidota bacterium]